MALTLELPPGLREELREEAEKTGLTLQEHITLLLLFAHAVIQESHGVPWSLPETVRVFVDSYAPGMGTPAELRANLLAWAERYAGEQPVTAAPVTHANGHGGRLSAMGKYAHLGGSSDEFAREKQFEIDREERRYR